MTRAPSALVVVVLLTTSQAHGYGLGQVRDPALAQAASRASSYLKGAQLRDGRWTWREGESRAVAENFGGLVAEAVLASYEQGGDLALLASARAYGDYLLGKFADRPEAPLFKPDVEFLVRLSEVTGDDIYQQVAARWFEQSKRLAPTGAHEVRRVMAGRAKLSDIVGYDVALGIRAALAVGDMRYARSMAAEVWRTRGQWLIQPRGTFGTISRAALLDAATALGDRAVADALRLELEREQLANGSWCFNGTQATAYAVRALANVGSPTSAASARRGARWLGDALLARGAWPTFNDGLPEPFVGDVHSVVNAEALTALILASRR